MVRDAQGYNVEFWQAKDAILAVGNSSYTPRKHGK